MKAHTILIFTVLFSLLCTVTHAQPVALSGGYTFGDGESLTYDIDVYRTNQSSQWYMQIVGDVSVSEPDTGTVGIYVYTGNIGEMEKRFITVQNDDECGFGQIIASSFSNNTRTYEYSDDFSPYSLCGYLRYYVPSPSQNLGRTFHLVARRNNDFVVMQSFVFPGDIDVSNLEDALKELYEDICCECEGLGGSTAGNFSLNYRISTGTKNNGINSLGLTFKRLRPDGSDAEDWLQPYDYDDDVPSNVGSSYITESGFTAIEQVNAADVFVDIDYGPISGVSSIADKALTINFYLPEARGSQGSNGLYDIVSGSKPFRQVRIYQPTGSPNDFYIEERSAFSSGSSVDSNPDKVVFYRYEYQSAWTDPNTLIDWDDYWLFTEGVDLNSNASFDASTETVRQEISQVRLDSGEFVKERKVQAPISGGGYSTEVVEEYRYLDTDSDGVLDDDESDRETIRTVGSGSDQKTWQWGYYNLTDASDLRLRFEIDPYGGWRYLDYNTFIGATNDTTHLSREIRGFLDTQYSGSGTPPSAGIIDTDILTNISSDSNYTQLKATSIDGQPYFNEEVLKYVQNWDPDGIPFNGDEQYTAEFREINEFIDSDGFGGRLSSEIWNNEYAAGVSLQEALLYGEYETGTSHYSYDSSNTSNGDLQSGLFKVTEIREGWDGTDGTISAKLHHPSGQVQYREFETLDNQLLYSEYSADTDLDDFGRPLEVVYGDGSTSTAEYSCCGLSETVSRDGVVTRYHEGYKQLRRPNLAQSGQFLDAATILRKYEDTVRRLPNADNSGFLYLTFRTYLDTQGRAIAVERIEGDASSGDTGTFVAVYQYSDAGNLTRRQDEFGREVAYSEQYNFSDNGQQVGLRRIATLPDSETITTDYHLDGRLLSVTGSAVHPIKYEYRMEQSSIEQKSNFDSSTATTSISAGLLVTKEIFPDSQSGETEWREVWADGLGRTIFIITPDADGDSQDEITEFRYYKATDYVWEIEDADGVVTSLEYDELGRVTLVDGPQKQAFGYEVVTEGGEKYTETTISIFTDPDNDATSEVSRISRSDFYGNKAYEYALGQETVITSVGIGGIVTNTVSLPDDTSVQRVYREGYLTAERSLDVSDNVIMEQSYFYTSTGRLIGIEDLRNGLSSRQYDYTPSSEYYYKITTTSPDPDQGGSGDEPLTATYAFNNIDQLLWIEFADNKKQYFDYWPTGELKKIWGARTNPVEYAYDHRGRLKTLTTWQQFNIDATTVADATGVSGSAVTTWEYNPGSGLLERKLYPQVGSDPQQSIDYAYTAAGRLDILTNARDQDTQYRRDAYGRVDGIDIGDDDTYDVEYTLDRSGRVHDVTDLEGGNHDIIYLQKSGTVGGSSVAFASGQIDSMTYTSGPLSGLAVDYGFDALSRYNNLAVTGLTSGSYNLTLGYDASTGRLSTATHGGGHHIYEYVPNSALIQNVHHRVDDQAGSDVLTETKSWDYLNRLTGVTNTSSALNQSIQIRYNRANLRDRITYNSAYYWEYDYDDLGQVKTARKRAVTGDYDYPGGYFGYEFDNINNRTSQERGSLDGSGTIGDAGDVLSEISYYPETSLGGTAGTANVLNQSLSRSHSRTLDITGGVRPDADIVVKQNGQTVASPTWVQDGTNTGDAFHLQLDYTSQNDASLEEVGIFATIDNTDPQLDEGAAWQDDRLLSPSTENFTYDADGNLTSDFKWNYAWNELNQLKTMWTTSQAALAGLPVLKLEFNYDHIGRRIHKTVYTYTDESTAYNGAAPTSDIWSLSEQRYFLYDGWNLIVELSASLDSTAKFYWGLDISRRVQGAGGVGGLLAIENTQGSAFPCYDSSGNLIGAVDASDGGVKALYEYGPFGEINSCVGLMSDSIPFLWSTRYTDGESGLVNYTYRPYNPSSGSWLSRDPIGELGGLNLYTFVGNDPVNYVDPSGLDMWIEKSSGTEPAGHLSLSVGNPNGRYVSYSYGTDFSISLEHGLQGTVYEDTERGGEIVEGSYYRTTPNADRHLIRDLESTRIASEKDKGPYRLSNQNCRTWSKGQHEFYAEVLELSGEGRNVSSPVLQAKGPTSTPSRGVVTDATESSRPSSRSSSEPTTETIEPSVIRSPFSSSSSSSTTVSLGGTTAVVNGANPIVIGAAVVSSSSGTTQSTTNTSNEE